MSCGTITFTEAECIRSAAVDLHTLDETEIDATAAEAVRLGLTGGHAEMILRQARSACGVTYTHADVLALERAIDVLTPQTWLTRFGR